MERTVRAFIPIEVFEESRVERREVETPAVGERWGRPSAFQFSSAAAGSEEAPPGMSVSGSLPPGETPRYVRIIDAPTLVMEQLVTVADPADPLKGLGVRRIHTLGFQFTELIGDKGTLPQRTFTTLYDLTFNLHPPEEAS